MRLSVQLTTRSAAVVSGITESENFVPVTAAGVGAADAGAVGGRLVAAARNWTTHNIIKILIIIT